MKKKILPLALAAATGLVASTAQAVFVNPQGHGQVLLYPYYTVEGGNETYINLVNTTDETKAVKVRILEAMNSQEVLDFNLYLSPQDHWSAVIYADPNGEGAVIKTADTSCTVPTALAADAVGETGAEVKFRNFTYSSDDAPFNGLDRTREGYVEVIEMGVLTDATDEANVEHVNGVPGDCAAVAANWGGAGKWSADETADVDVPTGGLYGYGVLINPSEGTDATYDAVALANFIDSTFDAAAATIHAAPGSVLPALTQATPVAQIMSTDGTTVSEIEPDAVNGQAIDAVSAVLMANSIMNDFVLEPTLNASTDWVVTFPTKKVYVNAVAARAPFTNIWDSEKAQACEEIAITYYDREEAGVQPNPLDFSPLPPAGAAIALCHEANVVSFNNGDALSASDRIATNLDVEHANGWMEVDFTDADPAVRILDMDLVSDSSQVILEGLPVVGFAVQKYVNTGAGSNAAALANYAGTVTHKVKR